jgi:hypothetical protein
MCPADLNVDTIGGTIHIKMTFSVFPGTGKHFVGNAVCSSNNSPPQLIHILQFFTISIVFHNPPNPKMKNPEE